jgi:hypothetical protein
MLLGDPPPTSKLSARRPEPNAEIAATLAGDDMCEKLQAHTNCEALTEKANYRSRISNSDLASRLPGTREGVNLPAITIPKE